MKNFHKLCNTITNFLTSTCYNSVCLMKSSGSYFRFIYTSFRLFNSLVIYTCVYIIWANGLLIYKWSGSSILQKKKNENQYRQLPFGSVTCYSKSLLIISSITFPVHNSCDDFSNFILFLKLLIFCSLSENCVYTYVCIIYII